MRHLCDKHGLNDLDDLVSFSVITEGGLAQLPHPRWNCFGGTSSAQTTFLTPAPSCWGPIYRFWARQTHDPAVWLALLLTKAGDVETIPGPTNTQIWMCDVCTKKIYTRKQTLIRSNKTKHWVHLRCAGIRLAQYTHI